MTKRISPQRTPENSRFFTEDGEHIRLSAGEFDAISMVADGELVVGKIHKFYVTQVRHVYTSGATLVIKDIPSNIGAFKVRDPEGDYMTEKLEMYVDSPATVTTAMGEEIQVLMKLSMMGYTKAATGATAVFSTAKDIVAVSVDGELSTDHPMLTVLRGQTAPVLIDYDKSGFILEATAEVAEK